MLVRSAPPPTETPARSIPGSNGGGAVRAGHSRQSSSGGLTKADEPRAYSGAARTTTHQEDALHLERVLRENEPDLALLVREREPNYNDLLRERISWREFYTPLGTLFEQHLRRLQREQGVRGEAREWNGRLPK
jgi:hypothetical protein